MSDSSSPLNLAPNTNALNSQSMTSPQAALARQKSQEVMEALRTGEPGDADALMRRDERSSGGGWFKRLLTNTKREKKKQQRRQPEQQSQAEQDGWAVDVSGTSLDDHAGGTGLSAGQDLSMTSMARDGGKGDGVIR